VFVKFHFSTFTAQSVYDRTARLSGVGLKRYPFVQKVTASRLVEERAIFSILLISEDVQTS
jgi:hypothetical protein